MKASLYLKLGTAFVLIVIVSIISGIAAAEAIYQKQFRQEYQQQTTNVGLDFIRFYQMTGGTLISVRIVWSSVFHSRRTGRDTHYSSNRIWIRGVRVGRLEFRSCNWPYAAAG
ncbi:hypothetical protein [Paenibacillus xylaniclasticus]|uniref:hypothetical protein n=1 Tax=Paenibacillus xylaniclasticus TaxID=588083 RepID=UPI000FD733CD|nr:MULTISPECIES: hypothetical protein [Paenibacillus]GFN30164.1 hypothetical protein PCURB6_04240 [Paenibacillus curdlanolyticus]